MGDSLKQQERVGYFARIPHKQKAIIAVSVIAAMVPASALAFHAQASSDGAEASASVHTTATTPPDAPDTEPTPPNHTDPQPVDNNTTVTINGQRVDMPANGNINQTITSNGSSSHVEVNATHTGNSSSTSVVVNSSSVVNGSVTEN